MNLTQLYFWLFQDQQQQKSANMLNSNLQSDFMVQRISQAAFAN